MNRGCFLVFTRWVKKKADAAFYRGLLLVVLGNDEKLRWQSGTQLYQGCT